MLELPKSGAGLGPGHVPRFMLAPKQSSQGLGGSPGCGQHWCQRRSAPAPGSLRSGRCSLRWPRHW